MSLYVELGQDEQLALLYQSSTSQGLPRVVQWLRLCFYRRGGGGGDVFPKILHAACCSQINLKKI